jgi:glycosyltransferase involved in cell wall biosynthesis
MNAVQQVAAVAGTVGRVLLVSLSAPELDRLAVELAARGALDRLVRRYVNKQRAWERAAARLPLLREVYGATLGRRRAHGGVDTSLVVEAGVPTDFAAAVANRLGRLAPDLVTPLSKGLLASTERAIARSAGRHVAAGQTVVGSYHVAAYAFAAARRLGLRTVLNYPIAHHRWQYEFFAAQAESRPGFAAALPAFGNVVAHAAALDREIALADDILVGSTFVRDTFVAQGVDAGKLRVIPYGVDAARFSPRPRPRTGLFRALFVGQLGERKGLSYLLDAYRAFRKPDTELHLVGDFVKGAEVYRPYAELFRRTPNVPHAQLPALFRAADVFVFPSLVEGMPLVVLEAMACGLPTIVTPHGSADIVRDGIDGFVVRAGDSAAIAARLEQLYADRELRNSLGENARARAEHWSWQRYARAAADFVLGEERSGA